jgi:4-amino-4-deoxy-L-arabinose transferase-like glycosyltransferase
MADRTLFGLVLAGFLLMLFSVQYTGEEAVYTVSSYEMWFQNQLLNPTLFGDPYPRPPLINWFIIAISSIIGWDHSIVAVRVVSMMSTFGSASLIYWFLRRELLEKRIALLGVLLYLTMWQVIGGYGWKGYSDALFGTVTFTAIILGYLAIKESSVRWLIIATIFAYLGFLTKALTSFVFLFSALIVTALIEEKSAYLLKRALPIYLGFASFLVSIWYAIAPEGRQMAEGMFSVILDRYLNIDWALFFLHLFSFPFETALNALPVTILLSLLGLKKLLSREQDTQVKTFGFIGLVGFLPYWIAPASHSRYLMPLYGVAAVYTILWIRDNHDLVAQARKYVTWTVIFKLMFAAIFFPMYTWAFRPSIQNWAQTVKDVVGERRLYTVDQTWIGISVVDTVNHLNYPRPPVVKPYTGAEAGYILSDKRGDNFGSLVVNFDNKMFLYCFGSHCDK